MRAASGPEAGGGATRVSSGGSSGASKRRSMGCSVWSRAVDRVPLMTVLREWGRIGVIGFGGPPAHIALLRRLCVERRRWLSHETFEDGIAATNLLPGPA